MPMMICYRTHKFNRCAPIVRMQRESVEPIRRVGTHVYRACSSSILKWRLRWTTRQFIRCARAKRISSNCICGAVPPRTSTKPARSKSSSTMGMWSASALSAFSRHGRHTASASPRTKPTTSVRCFTMTTCGSTRSIASAGRHSGGSAKSNSTLGT